MPKSIAWTDQADARLLAAIIATCPPINYQKVAEALGNAPKLTIEPDLTANAVQHRIRKIKAKAKGIDSNNPTPAATPRKAQPSTPRKMNGSQKRLQYDDEDDDIEVKTEDSKKVKIECKDLHVPLAAGGSQASVKKEYLDKEEQAEEPVIKLEGPMF
ncbi:60S ribosomal protein L8B [Ascosphaera pollenicola]|nr:60S ribosomal protein L8B [Ascosphaera pollenicola]